MGHRQNMTDRQRSDWDSMQYRRRLEARKGSNYEYWNEKHEDMMENKGWDLYELAEKTTRQWGNTYGRFSTTSEHHAKKAVKFLRETGHYARIVCGLQKTVQRTKHYSVIYKKKKQ